MYIKKLFKRFAPVIALVAVVISLTVLPVSAVENKEELYFDWMDYAGLPMSSIDKPQLIAFYVNLPVDNAYWDASDWQGNMTGYPNTNYITVSGKTNIRNFAFGFPGSEKSYMLLDGIVSGEGLFANFTFEIDSMYAGLEFSVVTQARFYDENFNPLYDTQTSQYFQTDGIGVTAFTARAEIVYNKPAKYMDLVFFINTDSGVPMTISIDEVYFTVTLTQTQMDYLSTERTLQLMEQLKEQRENSTIVIPDTMFDSFTDKLNEVFMNSIGVPIYPEHNTGTNDYFENSDQLIADSENGRNEINIVISDVLTYLAMYAHAFGAVSWIFNCFYHHPFFVALLTLSLALGVCASLFGVVARFGQGEQFSRSMTKSGQNGTRRE